jgi:PAS domain S-box-containing protein
MDAGQAYVDADRCIHCGTCIRECPQNAKMYRNDIEKVKKILLENEFVAASLAPSFASLFEANEIKRLVSALRELGFKYIAETSNLAYDVAKITEEYCRNNKDNPVICSSCPAIVNLIEKYHKELVGYLAPVSSPMIAHARALKNKFGQNSKVVFIGPCIAKKHEAEREEYKNLVDAVITFEELFSWLTEEKINITNLDESEFDELPAGHSRIFPLPGGLLKTGLITNNLLDVDIINASGITRINEIISDLKINGNISLIVEPLFCSEGCINGPGLKSADNLTIRRKKLFSYYINNPSTDKEKYIKINDLKADYKFKNINNFKDYSDSEINEILEKTGKPNVENQLNCGSCGYPTCREKAIAVLQGMAEPEMCLPYMRRTAEQRANKIIETSPNAIVILNQYFNIIRVNHAFKKLFNCNNSVIGKNISYLLDQAPFEQLLLKDKNKIELTRYHDNINRHIHEIYYSLHEENQFIGIFVDITSTKNGHTKLKNIREQTIIQTQELLDHQIEMAQKIAVFLGENSAISEKIVKNILTLTGNEDERQ